jgi:hypothetical protein
MQFREKALSEINNRLIQVQSNLDQIYGDKLERVIDEASFQKNRAKYLMEQADLDNRIKQHRIADKKYVDFGCLVIDVSYLASKLYGVRNPEEKRYLLKFVFSNLSLRNRTVQNSFQDIFAAVLEYQRTKDVLSLLNKIRTFFRENPDAEF